MTYKETLDYLFSQLPMYQRIGKAAYKADLKTTLELDKAFNYPHKNYRTIHVAGTNGKGSVSHCVASILQEAGYKVGLYTSPHLKDFRERIRVNGDMIQESGVVQFVEKNQDLLNRLKPSFFEMTVAMAFDYFREQEIDIAVVEVGMGGRLDSTNIIDPILSIITNIGLDHTAFLGPDKKTIAGEKAGIIKKGVPVVIGQTQSETEEVFKTKAKEQMAAIQFADQVFQIGIATNSIDERQIFQVYKGEKHVYEDLRLDLLGEYQQKNVLTVLASVETIVNNGVAIDSDAVFRGLNNVTANTGMIGRWYHLGYNPRIVCDTGHNVDGIKAIVNQLANVAYKNLHIVLGMVDDKDHEAVLGLLPKEARYYFTRASIPRSLNEVELQKKADYFDLRGEVYVNPKEALREAKKNADVNDLIFIGGSTFIVADVL